MSETLIDNAPKLDVRESAIEGRGLIATEPIAAGESLIDFSDPERFRERRFDACDDAFIRAGKFVGISETHCLVAARATKFAFLNHSRTPNARLDLERRVVTAVRDVAVGEEITVDYRSEPMPPDRRGLIEDWL